MDVLALLLILGLVALLSRPFYAYTRLGIYLDKVNSRVEFDVEVNSLADASTIFIAVVLGIAFAQARFDLKTTNDIIPVVGLFILLAGALWLHRRPPALLNAYNDKLVAFPVLLRRIGMISLPIPILVFPLLSWFWFLGQKMLVVALIVDLVLQCALVLYLLGSKFPAYRVE